MCLSVSLSQNEAEAGCESSSGHHIQVGGLAVLSHILPAIPVAEIVQLAVVLRVLAEGEGPFCERTPFGTIPGRWSAEDAGHMPTARGEHTRPGV